VSINIPKNIIISGKIGVGKTTIVKTLLSQLSLQWGGYITNRIKEGGITIAHEMVTSDGRREVFAHQKWTHLPQYGQMGVQVEVFEKLGIETLCQARQTADIIVMDELGFMEANAMQFITEVCSCFNSDLPVVAVMKKLATDFWYDLLSPAASRIYNVTPQNRKDVLSEIIKHHFAYK